MSDQADTMTTPSYQVVKLGRVKGYNAPKLTAETALQAANIAASQDKFDPVNTYTGQKQPTDPWRVQLNLNGYIGYGTNLFFEDEQQATLFSLWEIVAPAQIVAAMPDQPFLVTSIAPTFLYWWEIPREQFDYIGAGPPGWTITMKLPGTGFQVQWFAPTEPAARAHVPPFSPGQSYTPSQWFVPSQIGTVESETLPAPADLTAVGGDFVVVLAWKPVVGADAYEILKSDDPNEEEPYDTSDTTTYTDPGVLQGNVYYYRVRAVAGSLESDLSNEAFAGPIGPPAAPDDLLAFSQFDDIYLTWNAIEGATSYNVLRALSSGAETPYDVSATNSYTDINILVGPIYYYKVQAVNADGTSGLSNEASSVGDISAPQNLTATGSVESIVLAWDGSTGATYYMVYRGMAQRSEASYVRTAGPLYIDSKVVQGVAYWYYVKAFDANGASNPSNEVSAIAGGLPVPTMLIATPAPLQIQLSWQPPIGIAVKSYNVLRGTASGGEKAYGTSAATSFVDAAVIAGTTYFYTVTASTSLGVTGQSNEASAASITVLPATPTGLTASAQIGAILLNWTEPAGPAVDDYQIWRGTTSGQEQFYDSGVVDTTYLDDDVSYGVVYFYKVQSVNTYGVSVLSNEAYAEAIMPVPVTPAAPTNLAAVGGYEQIFLRWNAPPTAVTSYTILRSTLPGKEVSIATGITATGFTNSGLPGDEKFYYTVKAVNSAAKVTTSEPSDEASATTLLSVPLTPTGFAAVAGSGAVSLTWNVSQYATSYSIYRSSVSGAEIFVATVTGLTYLDTGLTNGRTYYYQIRAHNVSGYSPVSQPELIVTTFLLAPTGLRATVIKVAGGFVNTYTVVLTWGSVSGANGYLVVDSVPGGIPQKLVSTNSTTFQPLTSGRTHIFHVYATVNGFARSLISAGLTVVLPSS
jgi:fibronectin type 3 domain-containing protein